MTLSLYVNSQNRTQQGLLILSGLIYIKKENFKSLCLFDLNINFVTFDNI